MAAPANTGAAMAWLVSDPRTCVSNDRPDRPVLVLVSGLPGSGKTTHAGVLERRLSAIRLSADDWLEELALDL
jgi:signal recognition particle GTPase